MTGRMGCDQIDTGKLFLWRLADYRTTPIKNDGRAEHPGTARLAAATHVR